MKTNLAILASIMLSSATVAMTASANESSYVGQSGSTTAKSFERVNSTTRGADRTFGRAGAASQVTRVVDTTRSTQYLNLVCGETVAFTNGGEQFIWKFDVMGHRPIELAKIAPAAFAGSTLKIYVANNELERH
jgi:hypothetical protein